MRDQDRSAGVVPASGLEPVHAGLRGQRIAQRIGLFLFLAPQGKIYDNVEYASIILYFVQAVVYVPRL